MKELVKLTNEKARKFLLQANSYCNFDLPKYFDFQKIIDLSDTLLTKRDKTYKTLRDDIIKSKKEGPNTFNNVNYKIFMNKDGNYSWRVLELIHPILYVNLINDICEENNWKLIQKRMIDFKKNKNIICCSIPKIYPKNVSPKESQIKNWYEEFEQRSIKLSLNYSIMGITDISNCYPSIYTHSISWALHTKETAKKLKNDKTCCGNIIDSDIGQMKYGQTNGIPQGSIVMDLIAEIILGYADELLTEKLKKTKINDYKILRYRDDYRIFCNTKEDVEQILKMLAEILVELNFKLNESKTKVTNDIVISSLKKDKINRYNLNINNTYTIQKQLFIIDNFSRENPNSGSINTLLNNLYQKKISKIKHKPNSIDQMISITTDIMFNNINCYPLCIAILGKLFSFLKVAKAQKMIIEIKEKFMKKPNIEYFDIWLQRLALVVDERFEYPPNSICQKIYNNNRIWNSEWIKDSIFNKFDESLIIDKSKIETISLNLDNKEIGQITNNEYK